MGGNMRLRNKKTGEIREWERVGAIDYGEMNEVYDSAEYNSLAELNEDWEDYEPTEPLIKDPKARKLFRKWADLFGVEQFRVNHFSDSRRKTTSIGSTDTVTEPVIELPGHIGEDSEIYTKEELCGEEKQ